MKRDSFCPLPWNHLATHPNGTVTLCCESHPVKGRARNFLDDRDIHGEGKGTVYLGKEGGIATAMNSDYLKKVRRKMLNGEVPEACRVCFNREAKGVESKRIRERKNFSLTQSEAARRTEPDGKIDVDLEFIELRLGNTCNLKCRMCAPHSSSKWFGEYKQVTDKLEFVDRWPNEEEYRWPESPEFWEDLDKCAKNPRLFYINGGEPLLNSAHRKFLERLVLEDKAKSIELDYSSNMTVMPKVVLDLWPKFKRVIIRASIDDLQDRNTYIRYPSEWNVVCENLRRARQAGAHIVIVQTVNAMNMFYLDEFNRWADREGYSVAYNFMRQPSYLMPEAIPKSVRLPLMQKLKRGMTHSRFSEVEKLYYVDEDTDEQEWKNFVRYTRFLDSSREQKFSKVFSEFSNFLNEKGVEVP